MKNVLVALCLLVSSVAAAYENNETGATQALSDACQSSSDCTTAGSMSDILWDICSAQRVHAFIHDPNIPQVDRYNVIGLMDVGSRWMIDGFSDEVDGNAAYSDASTHWNLSEWTQCVAKSETAISEYGSATGLYGDAGTAFASADLLMMNYGY